jgi:hypothetical protein
MQNENNTKKGFRTFVLTLSVSLIIFSVVYFFMTNGDSSDSDSELLSDNSAITQEDKGDTEVVSPFGQLANKDSSSEFSDVPAVLAGSTVGTGTTSPTGTTGTTATNTRVGATQTSAAVPAAGTMEITIGLIMSSLIFAAAVFWNKLNPRKLALVGFEKKVLEDYDGEVRYTRKYTRYY